MAPTRWGDEPDEDSVTSSTSSTSPPSGTSGSAPTTTASGLTIPATTTRYDNSKNVKTVTSYKAHPGNPHQLIQTITKIKIYRSEVRESRDVELRRRWKRFGEASHSTDDSNVTIHSRDDVYLEDPKADTDLQDEDPGKALAGNLNAFWAKQQRRQLERKFDVDASDNTGAGGEEGKDDGWTKVPERGAGGAGGSSGGKYIPPSQRGGGSSMMGGKSLAAMAERGGDGGGGGRGGGGSDRDQNTIRVTNISEDTTEADLQDLFQPFGRISRVYLAKDKETLQSRGFAFVSFVHRDDAARAMEKLQGFGYDHLILKLEWARPSAPRDPGTEGTQFRSGYGKALAQDTKEKVSFASNLTRGVRG